MIGLNDKLVDIYKGENKISKVYKGDKLIYPIGLPVENNLRIWLDGEDYITGDNVWVNRADNTNNLEIINGAVGTGNSVIFNGIDQYGKMRNFYPNDGIYDFDTTIIIKFKTLTPVNVDTIKGLFGITGAGAYTRAQIWISKDNLQTTLNDTPGFSLPRQDGKWLFVAFTGNSVSTNAFRSFINGQWYTSGLPVDIWRRYVPNILMATYGDGGVTGSPLRPGAHLHVEIASVLMYDKILEEYEIEKIYEDMSLKIEYVDR